jgi:hypothetical protein
MQQISLKRQVGAVRDHGSRGRVACYVQVILPIRGLNASRLVSRGAPTAE